MHVKGSLLSMFHTQRWESDESTKCSPVCALQCPGPDEEGKKQFILALTGGELNVLNSAVALFFSCQRKSCSVIRLLGELCLCTVAQTVVTVLLWEWHCCLSRIEGEALLMSSSCASVKSIQFDSSSGFHTIMQFKQSLLLFLIYTLFDYTRYSHTFNYLLIREPMSCCPGSDGHKIVGRVY